MDRTTEPLKLLLAAVPALLGAPAQSLCRLRTHGYPQRSHPMRPSSVASTLLLTAFALLAVGPVRAATIEVTTHFDGLDNNPATCTLREAVQAANIDAAVDGCPAGLGADVILLAPFTTYELTLWSASSENANATGDLDLASDVTILGDTLLPSFAHPVIDATNIDRVLHVLTGASLRLERVRVRNGKTLSGSLNGGGILSQGHLELVEAGVVSNEAVNGGGIYLLDGTATIERSLIDSNVAESFGGGISQASAHDGLVVDRSSIRRNDAQLGGGLFGERIEIADSLFELNDATINGGGAYLDLAVAEEIVNSTFSSNTAGGTGGGLHVLGPAGGHATLANLTIAGNVADADADGVGGGGGLWASRVHLANSIVAGNDDLSGNNQPDCAGLEIQSLGYNLVGVLGNECVLNETTPTSQTGTAASPLDPLLDTVANNGGPTNTRALLAGSPAIDAGNPAGCGAVDGMLVVDQRWYGPRAVDGDGTGGRRCDVGAFELGATPLLFADGFESGDTGGWALP